MKDKLTLRNLLICVAFLFGLLVFIFSFLAAYRMADGSDWTQVNTIIWGARTSVSSDGSSHTVAPEDADKAVALSVVGAFLVLLGAVCALVIALVGDKFLKDEKVRKIVLFVAGGFMVLGGVFTFFTQNGYEQVNIVDKLVNPMTGAKIYPTVADYRKAMKDAGLTLHCALPVISGILAILGGGAVVASQFVPDKKLGK